MDGTLLFCELVFDKFIQATSGTPASVTLYSDESLYRLLGQLDKAYVQFRASQVSVGSGTPTITIALETSNDGIFWKTKSTPVSVVQLSVGALKEDGGFDTGGNPGGCYTRVAVTLTATTSPAANVQVMVAGRSAC